MNNNKFKFKLSQDTYILAPTSSLQVHEKRIGEKE